MRGGILALAVMALLPGALAEPGQGSLEAAGPAFFPPDATLGLHPKAAFTETWRARETPFLVAGQVTLALYEALVVDASADAAVQAPGRLVETHRLGNATLLLGPPEAPQDFLAFEPRGRLACALRTAGPSRVDALETATLGRVASFPQRESSDEYAFYLRQIPDALLLETNGDVRCEGAGWIKVHGPPIRIRSDGGEREVHTGDAAGPLEGASLSTRWAVVHFSEGTLDADATSWTLAAQSARGAWDGRLSLKDVRGEVHASDHRFVATGGDALLDGRLAGDARHVTVGDLRLLRLEIEGDLRATTLTAVPAAAAAPAASEGRLPTPLLLGLLAAPFVGGGYAVGRWSRRRQAALEAADCASAAGLAIAHERWSEAAVWLERVCAHAPRSPRAHADLGYALSRLGRFDDAFACFSRARSLGAEDAETLLEGARAGAAAGRPAGEVEAWLAAALAANPPLVTELEDPAFDPLRGRAGFEEFVQRAWERAGAAGDAGAA